MDKICSACKETKKLSEFNKRKASSDGLSPLCRVCQNARDNKAYKANSAKHIQNVRARTVKNNAYISALKVLCFDCGLSGEPAWIYDFDHTRDKVENVSRMLSHSFSNIQNEADKCEVVCSNCHRVRTYKRKHGSIEPHPPAKAIRTPALMRMWQALLAFKDKPCSDCNNKYHFSAMDCDHREPADKSGNPSDLARNSNESKFSEELLKCDVVCSNCHRKRGYLPMQGLSSYVRSLGGEPNERFVCNPLSSRVKLPISGDSVLAIFEDEWNSKQDLIKAMVRHRLGFPGIKLRASKLELRRLDKNIQFSGFFERNHLDGTVRASYAYGLYLEGKLVSCLSVRTNHQGEKEIARLASDYDYHVHGGAGRLVKAVLQEESYIVTFSNNRLSVGNVYKKLGFTLVQENKPSYWYTDGKERIWRFRCRRINDIEILKQFSEVAHTELAQASEGVFSFQLWGDRRPLWKVEDYGHRKWIKSS